MRSKSAQKLIDAIEAVAETRGAENVRFVHSVLVEACKYFEQTLGEDIYEKALELQSLPVLPSGVVGPLRDMYYSFGDNIIRVIDSPDAPLDMQEEIPYMIAERLRRCGISKDGICRIFALGIENLEQNRLPEIYNENAYIKRDGYVF